MKKIIALLSSFCLVCCLSHLECYALDSSEYSDSDSAVISASVPYFHTITAEADGAKVILDGEQGVAFSVDRLSQPTVIIRPDSGKRIKQVLLNGTDITAQINDGCYVFEPVYEDKTLTVITETVEDAEESDVQDRSHEDNPITKDDVNVGMCLLLIIAASAGVISAGIRRIRRTKRKPRAS